MQPTLIFCKQQLDSSMNESQLFSESQSSKNHDTKPLLETTKLSTPEKADLEFKKGIIKKKEVDFQICEERLGIHSLDQLAQWLGKKKCSHISKLLSIPSELMTNDIVKFTENVKKIERLFPALSFVSFQPSKDYIGHISLSMFKWDTDLSMFAHSKITSLYISCSKISDFSPLKNAKEIKKLSIIDCHKIKEFEFLLNMPALQELDCLETPIPQYVIDVLEDKGVKIWQPF